MFCTFASWNYGRILIFRGILALFLLYFLLLTGIIYFIGLNFNLIIWYTTIMIPFIIFASQMMFKEIDMSFKKMEFLDILFIRLNLIEKDCVGVLEELVTKGYCGFYIKDICLKEFLFNLRASRLKNPLALFSTLSFIEDKINIINDYITQLRTKKGNKELINGSVEIISKELKPIIEKLKYQISVN